MMGDGLTICVLVVMSWEEEGDANRRRRSRKKAIQRLKKWEKKKKEANKKRMKKETNSSQRNTPKRNSGRKKSALVAEIQEDSGRKTVVGSQHIMRCCSSKVFSTCPLLVKEVLSNRK